MVASAGVLGWTPARADNDNDKLPLYLSRTVDPVARDTSNPNQIWQGSGNPIHSFMVKRNLDAGIELALKIHFRQGNAIAPTYVDDKGLVHVEVPTGPQVVDPSRGVSSPHPGRAAWSFTFSYAALPGVAPNLECYDADLWFDLDPSSKTDYLKLELKKYTGPGPGQQNGYGWFPKKASTPVIGDDEGTAQVTQNSQNYAFYASLIDTNPSQPGVQPYAFGPAEFDIVLKMKWKGDKNTCGNPGKKEGNDTTIHAVVNVVP